MLTYNKIKLYIKFKGDIDGWARANKQPSEEMSDKDWFLIEGLIQDIVLVQRGLASIDFANNLTQRLEVECDGKETIQQLEKLAAEHNQRG
jgi:hypothetical protein